MATSNASTIARSLGGFYEGGKWRFPTPAKLAEFEKAMAAPTTTKWKPADAEAARECERLFQAGGPRVYSRDEARGDMRLLPWDHSPAAVLRFVGNDVVVYARRKVGRKYEWQARVAA
jgi:hypothetical protein